MNLACECGAPARGGVCQRGHRLDEGELSAAEHAERSAAGKASAAKRHGLKQWSADDKVFDGNSWDIDKLREGTPRHLDVNPREGGTGVNVWVPGHHYSSANVTEQRGGIRGNQRTGRWEVSDADSYPLQSKEGRYGGNEAVTYDSPEEALNVAIAHAHKSHIAYDEGVHDAVGGPKVGPVMPVDPAALAKRRDADESSLRKMAQGSLSPGAYDSGGRARLRAHGEASSDPELRKGAALIAAHKLHETCECGAPAHGPVCQRGHRLTETWSPEARAAALVARKAKRGESAIADTQDPAEAVKRYKAIQNRVSGTLSKQGEHHVEFPGGVKLHVKRSGWGDDDIRITHPNGKEQQWPAVRNPSSKVGHVVAALSAKSTHPDSPGGTKSLNIDPYAAEDPYAVYSGAEAATQIKRALRETWSPQAREAAAAARKAKREANMPEGLQWNKRKGALEGKYQGVPLERGTAYQGELAGGRVFTAHWTGEKDSDEEPIFKHVETGERRTFRHGKFFGRLSDVKPS